MKGLSLSLCVSHRASEKSREEWEFRAEQETYFSVLHISSSTLLCLIYKHICVCVWGWGGCTLNLSAMTSKFSEVFMFIIFDVQRISLM